MYLHNFINVYVDPNSNLRLLLYVPDSFIFALLIVLYGLIRYRLKDSQSSVADIICRKMSMYPCFNLPLYFSVILGIYLLVYTFINLFAIINRLQNYVLPKSAIFELYLLQFITQPLQGFLNAIAYLISFEIMKLFLYLL